MIQMNLLTKQKETENELMVVGGKGWLTDFGIDMYTLLYLKWIINKDLLFNTRNSDQCYTAACMGENRYMYIYGWVPLLFTWNYHSIVNQLCLCPCKVTLVISDSLRASVQLTCSVISNSLWLHGLLQHNRPPCPSSTPGVYSDSCPLSWWCHPAISSSVILFSSRLQSFWASGSFQMSQFFASGGQSIGVSASTSVLPMNIQDWFP